MMYLIPSCQIDYSAWCHYPLSTWTSAIESTMQELPRCIHRKGEGQQSSPISPANASLTVYHLGVSRFAPHELYI